MIRRALGAILVYASLPPLMGASRLLDLPEPARIIFLPISLPTIGIASAVMFIGEALFEWGDGT